MATEEKVKYAALVARQEASKAPAEHFSTVFTKVFDALIGYPKLNNRPARTKQKK